MILQRVNPEIIAIQQTSLAFVCFKLEVSTVIFHEVIAKTV